MGVGADEVWGPFGKAEALGGGVGGEGGEGEGAGGGGEDEVLEGEDFEVVLVGRHELLKCGVRVA